MPLRSAGIIDRIILVREADFTSDFRVRDDAIKTLTLTSTAGITKLAQTVAKTTNECPAEEHEANHFKSEEPLAVTVTN